LFSDAIEDRSIVQVQQLLMLCRQKML